MRREAQTLLTVGFSKPLIFHMALKASRCGSTIEAELLASGQVTEDAYYAALARALRLPFLDCLPSDRVVDDRCIDSQLKSPRLLRLNYNDRPPVFAVVPQACNLKAFQDRLCLDAPNLQDRMTITTPTAIRRSVWEVGAARRAQTVVGHLFNTCQPMSARQVMTGDQGFVAGSLFCLIWCLVMAIPNLIAITLHLFFTVMHLGALLLRIALVARCQFQNRGRHQTAVNDQPPCELPVYTVMLALYREAAVVPQLLSALEKLDWPPSLLDIKLVCEADDAETLAAIRAACPPRHIEIVEVPNIGPRTKPKALTYALAGARGKFLTIYDAEDRPHPQQLREAFNRFMEGPADLACLQAPLVIANGKATWISAIFALEYSALFRRFLPALGHSRLPLPLGGTSNHFRTDILIKMGGWDPFNVTEDADLGMRLYRLGYRADTLTLPTYEDAPTSFSIWLGQRTRWYKGWLQTWLVTMRHPFKAAAQMGWLSFISFQLVIGGMLIAALTHPCLFFFLITHIWSLGLNSATTDGWRSALLLLDTINIAGSYLVFFVLGAAPMSKKEKRDIGWKWLMIPVYWLGVSLAAWRAILELRLKPFYWSKTPHSPSIPANTALDATGKSGFTSHHNRQAPKAITARKKA